MFKMGRTYTYTTTKILLKILLIMNYYPLRKNSILFLFYKTLYYTLRAKEFEHFCIFLKKVESAESYCNE